MKIRKRLKSSPYGRSKNLVVVTVMVIVSVVVVLLFVRVYYPSRAAYEVVHYEVEAPRMQSEWLIVNVSGRVTDVYISNNATPPVNNLIIPEFQSLAALNHTYIGFLFFNISKWYGMGYDGCSSLWLNMTASPPQAYCAYSSTGASSVNDKLGVYSGPWPVYDDTGTPYDSMVNYGWYQNSSTGLLYIHYTTFDSNFAIITVVVTK